MIHIERFVNQLMSSNCYLIVDESNKHCLCIDPASEKSEREINYINEHQLILDYVILTHEHTDHTWGCNALVEAYPSVKVICSKICKENLKKEIQAYFLFYFNNLDYHYSVCRVDITTEELGWHFEWHSTRVQLISVPGHSMGSICVFFDGKLFSGDALLQSKPYINKRNGSKKLFYESEKKLVNAFPLDTLVFPGHGDSFLLKDYNYKLI